MASKRRDYWLGLPSSRIDSKAELSFVWNLLPNEGMILEKIPRDEEKESSSTSRNLVFFVVIFLAAGGLSFLLLWSTRVLLSFPHGWSIICYFSLVRPAGKEKERIILLVSPRKERKGETILWAHQELDKRSLLRRYESRVPVT